MTVTKILAVLFCVLACGFTALASTPEAVATQYFELLQEGRYDEIGELYAKQAKSEFRDLMSFVAEIPDEASSAEALAMFFGPEATRESVKAMSDDEFFASTMAGILRLMEQSAGISYDSIQVLGSVAEGEGLQHVVARIKVSTAAGGLEMETMEIISLTKTEEGWKLRQALGAPA